MSKSILVIGTPDCCDYCSIGRIFGMTGQVECMASKDIRVNQDGKTIPDWCPLKKVPEKKQYNGVDGITGVILEDRTDKAIHEAAALGWNACIEEILKESD